MSPKFCIIYGQTSYQRIFVHIYIYMHLSEDDGPPLWRQELLFLNHAYNVSGEILHLILLIQERDKELCKNLIM